MDAAVVSALQQARAGIDDVLDDVRTIAAVSTAGQLLAATLKEGGRVFSCGNGGSMCDAMHLAEELSGRFRIDRPPLAALAISDPGHLTCVANDYGYEQVFSRFLEAHATSFDCLVAISTSGSSVNVVNAAKVARQTGLAVICLTGRRGSVLGDLATVEICTPVLRFADRVQELHIKTIHIMIEIVERILWPEIIAKWS
jgi:D-sedoheptulose 7-phosphate isomerase